MARRSRRDRRSTQTACGAIPSPYIQRRVPHFDVLDDAQLQQLDQQVDWLIENIGVAFRDDPVALDIWRAAGVTPTGEHGDLIRADAQWIRDLVAKAPSQFTQISRKYRAKNLQNFRKSGTPRAQKLRALDQHALRILHNFAESCPSQFFIQIRKRKRPPQRQDHANFATIALP